MSSMAVASASGRDYSRANPVCNQGPAAPAAAHAVVTAGSSSRTAFQAGFPRMDDSSNQPARPVFSAADIGALAHLYRAEIYRSTVWRTRLDATTNWAVVATGIALSVSFSSASASPLPLMLVGLLVAVFLRLEARRYRFFDFWRIRAHVLEVHFFGPIMRGQGVKVDSNWNEILLQDYINPQLHMTLWEATGRRLRRNYGWLFAIQAVAYVGKLMIHPIPIESVAEIWQRAAVGPVPGPFVLLAGLVFHSTWITVAILTYRSRRGADHARPPRPERDAVLELASGQG
jgi:uncharacterized membrane protein